MTTKEFCARYAVDRKGTNSLKWDDLSSRFGEPDLLSMWVADMEFKAPEAVIDALKQRVEHGAFGYSFVPESYYEAFTGWEQSHFGYTVKKDWIRFGPGVVTSLYRLINIFTDPNDAVMIHTPVYYPFHHAVQDTRRKLICSNLINKNGIYSIDFEQFEKEIVENKVKAYILCSPHNPVGRVWTQEEVTCLLDICIRHHVLVLSDELHQDLIVGDRKQIPAALINKGKYADCVISLNAPSKTFNLASLIHSHIIIQNETLRNAYDTGMKKMDHTATNLLGITAAEAAYRFGDSWRQGLLGVVRENFAFMRDSFAQTLPDAVVTPLEGTYLAWLDLRAFLKPGEVSSFVQGKCRLAVDYGEWFGEGCRGFIRLNLATKPEFVHTAVSRLIDNLR